MSIAASAEWQYPKMQDGAFVQVGIQEEAAVQGPITRRGRERECQSRRGEHIRFNGRPVRVFRIKAILPPRSESHKIFLPSCDHSGVSSCPGSKVKRDGAGRCGSKIQISVFADCGSSISTATRRPSGESLGFASLAGAPSVLSCLPSRSNHASCENVVPAPV